MPRSGSESRAIAVALEEFQRLRGRDAAAEEEALSLLASGSQKRSSLPGSFDTVGDDRKAKAMRQADQCTHDLEALARLQGLNKTPIDLDLVHSEISQMV